MASFGPSGFLEELWSFGLKHDAGGELPIYCCEEITKHVEYVNNNQHCLVWCKQPVGTKCVFLCPLVRKDILIFVRCQENSNFN